MARQSKMWFRKDRKVWMVTINGKRHNLGPNKRKATEKFYELMAEKDHAVAIETDTLAELLDDFLTWTYENRAQKTADRYKDFCNDFCQTYGRVIVSELSPAHVTRWLSQRPTWNPTTKRNAITAVNRGFNWAVKNLGLRRNPIAGMEKPTALTRTTIVEDGEFEWLLENCNDAFRELMIVSWDCGSRPQETKRIEAKQVNLDQQVVIITAAEGAKGGFTRSFYIPTDRSMEIIRRLCEEQPEGPIFRNTRGNPWTKDAVKCQFQRLRDRYGKEFTHYALRHSYITRKLKAGVDSHVVATLAGHKNTRMIDQVYSHVSQDHAYMLGQAKRGA